MKRAAKGKPKRRQSAFNNGVRRVLARRMPHVLPPEDKLAAALEYASEGSK